MLWFMIFWFFFMQGGGARLTDTAQRRHCQFMVIQSLISSAYLHQFIISLNGNRLSQVPACRFVSFSSLWTKLHQNLPQSFVSNCFQTTVRFPQSDLLLTSSDETGASSKDVERIPLYCFSRLVIHFLLSGFTGLFFAREMHSTSVIR